MHDKTDNLLRKLTIIFFLGFITLVPLSTLLSKDKSVSEIENKILSQKPKFTVNAVLSKEFMNNSSSYVEDQFPLRTSFITFKNYISYLSGSRKFRDIYVSKNSTLIDKYTFNKEVLDHNIDKISILSSLASRNFKINSKLFLVPTAGGLYQDILPNWAITDNQEEVLRYVNTQVNKFNSKDSKESLTFYTPYYVLNAYKDYPIFFNTDHHWTQLGARLAYEDFYGRTINIQHLLNNKYEQVSDSFLGTHYSKTLLPFIKADKIFSYSNYNNFPIELDFSYKYSSLYDLNALKGKNKYKYFLHEDFGHAIIEGNGVNEILILKDSFAHAFIPFLTKDYRKIHVVDTRYYNLDIQDYLNKNKGITDIMYLYNLQTFTNTRLF